MSKKHTLDDLADSIADTVGDYRNDEIGGRSSEDVLDWVGQFDAANRLAILTEMDHVLKKVYISRETAESFLRTIATHKELVGDDPEAFWCDTQLLQIQQGGRSQSELVGIFDDVLQDECEIGCEDCDGEETFVYLDDAVFSGNRLLNDLRPWIANDAPDRATVHVVVMALHTGGWHYATSRLEQVAAKAKKKIKFKGLRVIELEDRRNSVDECDVLRPRAIPKEAAAYAKLLTTAGYPAVLRTKDGCGPAEIFSTENGRNLLEQEFLKKGVAIRDMCPLLPENARPLGYQVLKTLGFGSLLVTWRNCPNNAPLVLWAGNPWLPLFPRKTN